MDVNCSDSTMSTKPFTEYTFNQKYEEINIKPCFQLLINTTVIDNTKYNNDRYLLYYFYQAANIPGNMTGDGWQTGGLLVVEKGL